MRRILGPCWVPNRDWREARQKRRFLNKKQYTITQWPPWSSKDRAARSRCRSVEIAPILVSSFDQLSRLRCYVIWQPEHFTPIFDGLRAIRPDCVITEEPQATEGSRAPRLTHVNRMQPLAMPPHSASHPQSKGWLHGLAEPDLAVRPPFRYFYAAFAHRDSGHLQQPVPYTSCALEQTLVQQADSATQAKRHPAANRP